MEKAKVKRQYNQVYLESYKKEFSFISSSRKGENYAHCTVCNCDVKISHSGIGDIKDHVKTKKHCEFEKKEKNVVKIGTFFNSADAGMEVINAECLFANFIVEHNLPISIADHASHLFKKMFPKCTEAKNFACGRTKTSAIIKEMAVVGKQSLENTLKNVAFAISVDGSNDSDSQLYPVVIVYFNVEELKIKNSLFALPVLSGKSTGENIAKLVLETLESRNIDVKNCIAFSADNAHVMIGHKKGVAAFLKQKNDNLLVMGCICHLIHISAEKAAKALPVAIDDMICDIFYYLHKSSKRKEDLKELQVQYDVESHKILKHVCTRWLSLGRSLKRVLEQWDVLTSFFKNQIKQLENNKKMSQSLQSYQIPKNMANEQSKKRPAATCNDVVSKKIKTASTLNTQSSRKMTSKLETISSSDSSSAKCLYLTREERIFMFISSDLNKSFCLFLDYMIPTFEKTNCILQSQEPKIHLLNAILLNMYKEILSKFIKPNILKSATLIDLKYAEIANQKSDEELLIGSNTTKVVDTLKDNEKIQFYFGVRQYFVSCCDYIRHKFPINKELLLHAEVADFEKISEKSFKDIKYFLDKFPVFCYQEGSESVDEAIDKLQSEFCSFQIDDLSNYKIQEDRIDSKWAIVGQLKEADNSFKYSRLSKFMLCILTVPHSNAECERIFSGVRKTRTDFRSSLSNEMLENVLIRKSMQTGNCYEQNFEKQFLKRAKSATYKSLTADKK